MADTEMKDKELTDSSSPYITTPSEPRTPRGSISYQPVIAPQNHYSQSFDISQTSNANVIRYSPRQTKKLTITSLVHAVCLAWWMLAVFSGIYYTPVEEDYDVNEHGSVSAFRKQLTHFRFSLIGLVPAFLISVVKFLVIPRIFKHERNSEESRRLASEIDGSHIFDAYEKSELALGKWWQGYLKLHRGIEFALHVFGMVVTIWLAVGKFRGYIRPRGPFDDAICAFSDPALQGIDVSS